MENEKNLYVEAKNYEHLNQFIIEHLKDFLTEFHAQREPIQIEIWELCKEANLPPITTAMLKSTVVGWPMKTLLNLENKISRKIFEKATGIKLPKTIYQTEKVLYDYAKKPVKIKVQELENIRLDVNK